MTNRTMKCVGWWILALGVAGGAIAQGLEAYVVGPRLEPAEKAWEHGKRSGNLEPVKAALRPVFMDPEPLVRLEGWQWIGSHKADMTREQRFELIDYYMALHPDDKDNESRRINMAREEFEAWPLKRREEAYWEAVKQGSVVVEECYKIERIDAIAAAAYDGLVDFAPLVRDNAALIDSQRTLAREFRFSEYLRWMLELEGGREEGADRLALAAARVGDMPPQKVIELMEHDAAFLYVVRGAFRDSCTGESASESAACRGFARIALAQRDLRLKSLDEASIGQAQRRAPKPAPDWLGELWEVTSAARRKEAKNRDDAERGDLLMLGRDHLY